MKKILFAVVGLLIGQSAFAEYVAFTSTDMYPDTCAMTGGGPGSYCETYVNKCLSETSAGLKNVCSFQIEMMECPAGGPGSPSYHCWPEGHRLNPGDTLPWKSKAEDPAVIQAALQKKLDQERAQHEAEWRRNGEAQAAAEAAAKAERERKIHENIFQGDPPEVTPCPANERCGAK